MLHVFVNYHITKGKWLAKCLGTLSVVGRGYREQHFE